MKVVVEIDQESHDVQLASEGSHMTARVGDRDYSLEVSEPEPNVFLLKNEGKVFEAFVSPDGSRMQIRIGTTDLEATVIDPKRLRGSKTDHDHGSGQAEIKTAMPGKVVRILVAVGDEVQKGDGVIVIEAMKMQNEMRSPKDGTVSEIKVAESDTVGAGDILIVID